MKPCAFPSNCPHAAVVTVRIARIGDRPVCQAHLEWMTDNGMDFRQLHPNAYTPEWRKRDLKRVMSSEPAL